MRLFFLTLLLGVGYLGTLSAQRTRLFDTDPPAQTPKLFAPGFVSGPFLERDLAISTAGDELYFSTQSLSGDLSVILVSRNVKGTWTAPEVASFSGKYHDIEPFLSADGRRLYFSSNRPKHPDSTAEGDYDIWYTDRNGTAWQAPRRLEGPVNTEKDEFYPSLSRNGTLYFTANYAGGTGGEDIYQSRWEGGQFQKPEVLPEAVNSKGHEFNAFVDPQERFLLFTAYGRKEGLGRGDLYVSFRDAAGVWQPARMLPEPLNSAALDYCPYVSPDGKWLFFSSKRTAKPSTPSPTHTAQSLRERLNAPGNGLEDIFWVEASVLWQLAK
ncbi:MAG: PD40 domain-containing protein [Sphingobacteriaceae bacterium]|nr:PD40 domain-containing protein [Cytophagaceae bacterium]